MESVSYKNDNSASLHFIFISPDQFYLLMKLMENLISMEFPRVLFFIVVYMGVTYILDRAIQGACRLIN